MYQAPGLTHPAPRGGRSGSSGKSRVTAVSTAPAAGEWWWSASGVIADSATAGRSVESRLVPRASVRRVGGIGAQPMVAERLLVASGGIEIGRGPMSRIRVPLIGGSGILGAERSR